MSDGGANGPSGQRYRANPSRQPSGDSLRAGFARDRSFGASCGRARTVHDPNSNDRPCSAPMAGRWPTTAITAGARGAQQARIAADRPDWRIFSVQGAVLDQLGRHGDAQQYYASALRLMPDEPSVLSNLGLSYALSKNLKEAEVTLQLAAAQRGAEPKVRQNLALVVGLQGRFQEAGTIAKGDLSPSEAPANVAYLRQILAQQRLERKKANTARRWCRRRGHRLPSFQFSLRSAEMTAIVRRLLALRRWGAGWWRCPASTGKKNRIIGTVSLGGNPTAFFSASDMRMSRFSCDITRSVKVTGSAAPSST